MKKTVCMLTLCTILAGCNEQDAKTSWNDVAKNCAVGDLSAPTVYVFGPSTFSGPGSLWQQGADRVPHVVFDLKDIKQKNFVAAGASPGCKAIGSTTFGYQAVVSPESTTLPVTGAIAMDLKKAKSVSVTASAMAWDTLRADRYTAAIHALQPANPIRKALMGGQLFVMTRALRVKGFSVTLHFDSSDVAVLKDRYNGPIKGAVTGNVGGTITATWSPSGDLTLTASDDFYVAGELSPYKRAAPGVNEPSLAGMPISIGPLPADKRGPILERRMRY